MKDYEFSLIFNFEGRKFEVFLDKNIKFNEFIKIVKKIILNKCFSNMNYRKFLDINENKIEIKKNFVPYIVNFKNNNNQTLKDLNFESGENIEIYFNEDTPLQENSFEIANNKSEFKFDFSNYSIQKITIPGDNSCLFNAVNYAFNKCMTEPQILRELVSSEIKNNNQLYNKAVLECEPSEYCDWIMRSDTWGGGIELSILAKFFKVRFDILDIQNNTIERIGDVRF